MSTVIFLEPPEAQLPNMVPLGLVSAGTAAAASSGLVAFGSRKPCLPGVSNSLWTPDDVRPPFRAAEEDPSWPGTSDLKKRVSSVSQTNG